MPRLRPLDVITRLAGAWRGEGVGVYPGAPSFRYREETTMTVVPGWNMLHVVQKTWREGGEPLHLEVGLVVPRDDGTLLYDCAQDGGRTEVMVGVVERAPGGAVEIAWTTTHHGNDARILKAGRVFRLSGEALAYEAYLSTVRTHAYRRHLDASLAR
jgi:hypothetical protein